MHLLDSWCFIVFFFQMLLHLFIYCVFTCLCVCMHVPKLAHMEAGEQLADLVLSFYQVGPGA